ncbi:MAG TPA: DUF4153 domain-containing protein, partial [Pseudolabrys sp.]
VTPEHFDFAFLRFHSGHFGTDALERLAARAQGPQAPTIAQRANQARRANNPYDLTRSAPVLSTLTPAMLARNITVVQPKDAVLPDQFLQKDWKSMPRPFALPPCLRLDAKCEAIMTDLDGDGQPEILLFNLPIGGGWAFKSNSDNDWVLAGTLTNGLCAGVREALRAGRFETESPQFRDLVVDGQRMRLTTECTPKPEAASSPGIPAQPSH